VRLASRLTSGNALDRVWGSFAIVLSEFRSKAQREGAGRPARSNKGSGIMRKALQLTVAISLATSLGLTLSAIAQQPHEQGQNHHPGQPGQRPPGQPGQRPPGPPGGHPGQAFHPPGPGGAHGPPGPHVVHALGERGYSFRGPGGVRREIAAFSPREREIWLGGRWHHDMRFGRFGYWWEVNGAWYFYDRPFEGPPAFVSEVEFMDDGLNAPVGVVGAPAPVVVAPAPAVVVAPPPVVVVRPPPVVCVGPLCVR
jgi:hypothetical protein